MRHALACIATACIALTSALTAHAAGEVNDTGTTGLSFLSIPPTARIAALGGGSMASGDGASGLWSNPALLAGLDGRSAQFTHTAWIEGIAREHASIAGRSSFGGLGMSVDLFDSGDIEGRDDFAAMTGSYSIRNVALTLGYARPLTSWMAVGVSYKRLFEKIAAETAQGHAVDAGIVIKAPVEGLVFGAAAHNYGSMGRLLNDKTKLPSNLSAGVSYTALVPGTALAYTVIGDAVRPRYGDAGIRTGIECMPLAGFALRLGYRTDNDIESISYGVGFVWETLSADVAYTPMSKGFDDALRFSLELAVW